MLKLGSNLFLSAYFFNMGFINYSMRYVFLQPFLTLFTINKALLTVISCVHGDV